MGRNNYLFNTCFWYDEVRKKKRALCKEIDGIEGNRLLNTSIGDLCNYFVEKYGIDVPVLLKDQLDVTSRETKIDISRDRRRDVRDRSRPYYVRGTVVALTVPFTGDSEAFKIQPPTFGTILLAGRVVGNTLVIDVKGDNLDSVRVRAELDRNLSEIGNCLDNLRAAAGGFNKEVAQLAADRINWRRNKLLADQELVASLGFPIRERMSAGHTFEAPEVKRRIVPSMPVARMAAYKPEPALSSEDYNHILKVATNMALVMERSPKAFLGVDEEALRFHILVQLNGHYEGQATGETFNYEGKTDVLIRVNGKNIFIAECKFWNGPKVLVETIDQLLGYLSWRDTKTAIFIFSRNKNFSRVLGAIPDTVKSHSQFKREEPCDFEAGFRYRFAHKDDANRELTLTILAFAVPTQEALSQEIGSKQIGRE